MAKRLIKTEYAQGHTSSKGKIIKAIVRINVQKKPVMNDENNENQQDRRKSSMKSVLTTNALLVGVIAACLFMGGYWVGNGSHTSSAATGIDNVAVQGKSAQSRVDFDLFWRAWDKLGERYVDQSDLNPNDLLYGAIKGMFAATGDPYTTFFDPEETQAFNEELDGSFEGIGAEIGIENNLLTIIAPLDGSPAEKAGLRAGDLIIRINDEVSADLSITEAVKLIRGEKGTDVILTIFREGEDDTRDVAVTRDRITIESVTSETRGEALSIRVSQFGNDTTGKFRTELQDAAGANVKKMIIDLRNNPGGILNGAVDMVGFFVPKGSLAVTEQSSNGAGRSLETRGNPIVGNDVEIVILINQGSASASEIFAAALKAHLPERVTLLGEKSFGKGSVQELIPMKDQTAAKITIAKWLTPTGKHIDGEGIEPDITVEYTNEDFDVDRDPQLDAAEQVLSGTYVAGEEVENEEAETIEVEADTTDPAPTEE